MGWEGHVCEGLMPVWLFTEVGLEISDHSISNQVSKKGDQRVNFHDFGYAKKGVKTNYEKEAIPGVGFEPTRTIRPLELKSNASTTRPSW